MAFNPMYDTPATIEAQAPMMMASQPSAPMMYDSPAVAREVAQVQAQIIIAKKFPRDENASLRKIDRACSRPALANSAIYTYSRGGTEVTGPSARLAEELARDWGNIKSGYEPIDSNENETTIRCYAYDMEENTVNEITVKVPHVRYSKKNGVARVVKLEDPRDIYETIANQASRRVRACILKTIPGDIVEHAVDMCRKTQASNVKITPESLSALCESFAQFNVAKVQIEAFIQRNLEAITIDQYLRLRQIYQGLVGGMSKVSDFFRPLEEIMAERGETPKSEPAQEKAEPKPKKKTAKAEAKAPEPTPAPAPEPVQEPEVTAPEDFEDDFDEDEEDEEAELPGFDF